MLSHIGIGIGIGISDFDRALAFYTPLMACLGNPPRFCDRSRPWAGLAEHWRATPAVVDRHAA